MLSKTLTYLLLAIFLNISNNAFADVKFVDSKGVSDHTIIFKKVDNNVSFLKCSVSDANNCVAIGNSTGYNLKELVDIAKTELFTVRVGSVLMILVILIGLLLTAGMTLITAIGAITSLATGALSTALVSVVVTVLAGGNFFMLSKRIPDDSAQIRTVYQDTRALNNGLKSNSLHEIAVSDLEKFESDLIKITKK